MWVKCHSQSTAAVARLWCFDLNVIAGKECYEFNNQSQEPTIAKITPCWGAVSVKVRSIIFPLTVSLRILVETVYKIRAPSAGYLLCVSNVCPVNKIIQNKTLYSQDTKVGYACVFHFHSSVPALIALCFASPLEGIVFCVYSRVLDAWRVESVKYFIGKGKFKNRHHLCEYFFL